MEKISRIGGHASAWAEKVAEERGTQSVRVLLGLLNLSKKHSHQAVNRACETALASDCYHLKSVRKLIGRQAPSQQTLEFMQEHEVIRRLSDYDEVIRIAFRKQGFSEQDSDSSTSANELQVDSPHTWHESAESQDSLGEASSTTHSQAEFPPITLPFSDRT